MEFTVVGEIKAEAPITNRMLNILDPITLPMAMQFCPFIEAVILTAASGALVPNATIVRPIISYEIFSFFAIFEDPSTK